MAKGNNPKVQLDAGLNTGQVDAGLKKIEAGAEAMASKVGNAAKKAAAGIDGMGASADAAAKKAERATSDLQRSLQRYVAQLNAGDKGRSAVIEEIAKQRGANLDTLRPLIEEARKVEESHRRAAGAVDGLGLSAKQTRVALQGVPAQLTDIFVSLQGGQAPLTVLLQQGGQLKDMFGGVVPAAQALGGAIAGLVTPLTLTAAAVALLGYGFIAGRKENEEFVRSLALTGNRAGETAGSLAEMAARLDSTTSATQSRSAEVLAALVSSGRVAGAQLERVAAAAIELDRVGGPAVEDTVKAFASLGKDPLQASIKLNEATGFLTGSVYEQIKALSEQGRTVDAARVAQEAYAKSIEDRAPEIAASLGYIERAWKFVKNAGAEALDGIKGIGRGSGLAGEIQAIEARIAANNRDAAGGQAGRESAERGNAVLTARLRLLQQAAAFEALSAAYQREQAIAVETKVEFDKDGLRYLTERDQKTKEIAKAEEQAQRLVAAGLIDEAQARERVAYIRALYESPAAIERIKAAEAVRAEELKQRLQTINLLRVTGYMGEMDFIRQNSEVAVAAIDNRIAAVRGEIAVTKTRHDGAKDAAKLETELAQLLIERETARRAGIYATTEAIEKQRRAVQGVVLAWQQEQIDDINKALVEQSKARERVNLGLYEYSRGIKEEADLLELERTLVGASNRTREVTLAQYRIELELKRRIAEIDATVYEGGELEREEKRAEARAAAARAMVNASQRALLSEWSQTTDRMSYELTDAIAAGFENGSSFSKKFRDTFVGYMREAFQGELRRALQWVTNPGTTGGGGSTLIGSMLRAGGYGGAGSAGSYLGTYSGATYGTDWGSEQSRMLAEQEAGMGSSNAVGTAAAAAAAVVPWVGAIVAAYQRGSSDYDRGFRREQSRTSGTILGDASYRTADLMSRLGLNDKWADLLSGATLTARAFGWSAPQTIAGGVTGTFGAADFSGQQFADMRRDGGWFRSDKNWTELSPLNERTGAFIDQQAGDTFSAVEDWAKTLRLPVDQLRNITRSMRVELTGDAAKDREAIAKAVAEYQEALSANFSEILEPFRMAGETATETLSRLAGLQTFADQVNELGGVFSNVAGLSFDARQSLVEFAGGIDEFKQKAQDFVQNYYSRDEIAGVKARDIVDTLGKVGLSPEMLAGLDTRDEFRELVESRDVTTVLGREQLAALLNVQGSFADLADYLLETGGTLTGTVGQAPANAALDGGASASVAEQVGAIFDVRDSVDEVARLLQRLIDVTTGTPTPGSPPPPAPPPRMTIPVTEVTGGQ